MTIAGRRVETWILWLLLAVGFAYATLRFTSSLREIANINNAYPWGWWTGWFMSLIAFGGAGFTTALLVEIFGMHRFKPFLRPGLILGLLFYLGYTVVLMIELGRPWMGFLVFFTWAPTSPLWEIAWCATLYMICLFIEFGHTAAEENGWKRTARLLGAVFMPLVVVGVALSHIHQTSLGTVLTIVPLKVDARWWSHLLPALFLVTAYIGGLAIVSVEHVLATYYLRLRPRVDLLAGLALIQVLLIGVFLVLRVGDLVFRDVVDQMLSLQPLSLMLWIEIVVFFLVPMVLFAVPETRNTLWGPLAGSALLVAGVLSTRLNAAVFAMNVRHWETYFPSMGEFMTSLGVLAAGILAYMWLIKVLPVHAEEPIEALPRPAPAAVGGAGAVT